MRSHFSELTDSEWQFIAIIINAQRKRKHSLQLIVNAICWINTTGCQWRDLNSKYPPWQTVFYHFMQFKLHGIWEELLDALVVFERKRQDREAVPSLIAIDS